MLAAAQRTVHLADLDDGQANIESTVCCWRSVGEKIMRNSNRNKICIGTINTSNCMQILQLHK